MHVAASFQAIHGLHGTSGQYHNVQRPLRHSADGRLHSRLWEAALLQTSFHMTPWSYTSTLLPRHWPQDRDGRWQKRLWKRYGWSPWLSGPSSPHPMDKVFVMRYANYLSTIPSLMRLLWTPSIPTMQDRRPHLWPSRTLRWNSALTTAFVYARHIRKLHLNRITLPILDSWPLRRSLSRFQAVRAFDMSYTYLLDSAIADIADVEGAFLFPISLDVVLDPVKGDLLSDDVQSFWLRQVVAGMVLATLAGPPCETWSVSRWRQLEDGSGPRPVRSTEDLFRLIWSLTPLRIRELRQTTVGNKLLQFALLMMGAHAVSGTLGILEHPSAPDAKSTGVPASIWRLPIVQLMRKHPNVGLAHIKQGFFGARSPKPTTVHSWSLAHHIIGGRCSRYSMRTRPLQSCLRHCGWSAQRKVSLRCPSSVIPMAYV